MYRYIEHAMPSITCTSFNMELTQEAQGQKARAF